MDIVTIDRLRRRIGRAHKDAHSPLGPGDSVIFLYRDASGQSHSIRYLDINKPGQWEDLLHNLIHWVAVLKDHLKSMLRENGKYPERIETYVNEQLQLGLCIDLDNREKHVNLRKSRSHLFPTIGDTTIRFPMTSKGDPDVQSQGLMMIQPGATRNDKIDWDKMEFKYPKPHLVTVTAPVTDKDGNRIGDAFEIVEEAIACWERLIGELAL